MEHRADWASNFPVLGSGRPVASIYCLMGGLYLANYFGANIGYGSSATGITPSRLLPLELHTT